MKTKSMLWLAAVLLTGIFYGAFAPMPVLAQEVITNQTVVELVKKGMSDKEIVAIVRSSKSSKFDVSNAAVDEMMKAGVSKDVIRELEEKSRVSPGFPSGAPTPDTGQRGPGGGTASCEGCIRYRVVATGFIVTTGTTEGLILTDGRGDEVFVAANFAEINAANTMIGSPGAKRSVNYGDTDGRSTPVQPIVGIGLSHPVAFGIMRGGSAEPHGGFLSGDTFPARGVTLHDPPTAPASVRGRFIPMTLWEGDLRAGVNPTAVLILPTIWENDFIDDMWNVWNRQAGDFLHRFARSSSRYVSGSMRRQIIEQVDNVLEYAPTRNDYSRPIGTAGDAFGGLAASPNPATFIPAAMFLTAEKAEEAVAHGEYIITYRDGEHFGPGEYKLMVRVERVGR
jgi:hypothetical protein